MARQPLRAGRMSPFPTQLSVAAARTGALTRGRASFRLTHHKGIVPWRGRFVPNVASPHLLRGAPGILPGGRSGINKQRIVPITTALTATAHLLSGGAAVPFLLASLGLLV